VRAGARDFGWSFLSNLEGEYGYDKRFEFVRADFTTQACTARPGPSLRGDHPIDLRRPVRNSCSAALSLSASAAWYASAASVSRPRRCRRSALVAGR
jgi:hypothetical protein